MKLKRMQLVMLLVTILFLGCSPKSSYRVLSVFFDGVPDSAQMANNNNSDTVARFDSLQLTSRTIEAGPQYYQHTPYLKQECDGCHSKGSRSSLLLPQPGLCYKCHADFSQKFKVLHGPVAGGFCTECHAPHLSEIPKLLRRKGQDLCYYCHNKEQILKVSSHKDIGESECTKCHDPHGGSNRFVLK